jgi:hypothetical protein
MRYFFDLYDGAAETRDEDGIALRDLAQVKREAQHILGRLACEEAFEGKTGFSVKVRDEAGRPVYALSLNLEETNTG